MSVEGLPVLDVVVNLSVKDPTQYYTNTLMHAYASGLEIRYVDLFMDRCSALKDADK